MPETQSVTYKDGPYRSLSVDDLELKRGGPAVDVTEDQLTRLRATGRGRGVRLEVPEASTGAASGAAKTTKPKEGSTS